MAAGAAAPVVDVEAPIAELQATDSVVPATDSVAPASLAVEVASGEAAAAASLPEDYEFTDAQGKKWN
eukprot:4748632-Amphidinium_carterae.1